jgi:hypothetical protein
VVNLWPSSYSAPGRLAGDARCLFRVYLKTARLL